MHNYAILLLLLSYEVTTYKKNTIGSREFYGMGTCSVDMVVGQIAGDQVAHDIHVKLELDL